MPTDSEWRILRARAQDIAREILGFNPPEESVDKILEILLEQEKESNCGVNKEFKSPVGYWQVTTERDVEGNATVNLGTFYGHVADISAHLVRRSYYKLMFYSVEPDDVNIKKPTEPREVRIALGIKSGTWDLDREERAGVLKQWLSQRRTKFVKYDVIACDYFAAVTLKIEPKIDEEIKSETGALDRPKRRIVRRPKSR